MRLTAITCTTPERKEALDLCKVYVDRQTRKPDQWLVLDGPEAMQQKLKKAIAEGQIEGDYIVFAEDDDWFAPSWFAWCEARLGKGYDIVGQGNALYYNVAHRWWSNCNNHRHASLCQTAISKKMLVHLWRIIDDFDCPWVDVQLWGMDARKYLHLPKESEMLLVGIKGMFEQGYSREHRQISGAENEIDYDLSKLRSLIGSDAENYAAYFHGEEELLRLAGAL
jgi:hypothetical protein